MDILTQIVLGGAVSSQILKNENSRKAILAGCVLGAIPDLDMLLVFNVNDFEELILHRSFSHAILPFLILTLLLLYFNKFTSFFKNSSSKRLFATFFLVLLTHALLDCLTTWGTQLFWPFDVRIATQTIYVIDLIYSGVLGIGLVIYFVFPERFFSRKINKWALVISSVYLLLLFSYQQYFIEQVSHKPTFSESIRIATQPVLFSPFEYRAVIEFQDSFMVSRNAFDVLSIEDSSYFSIPKNETYFNEISDKIDLYPLFILARGYLTIDKVENNFYIITDLRYPPIKTDTEQYESVFTYYINIENGKAEFTQNMRTYERLKKLFNKIFI